MKKLVNEKLHKIPKDLKESIRSNKKSEAAWQSLTPLAQNEWICWVISVKKIETRKNHIDRARTEIAGGKRRPCCFAGCPHR